MTTLRDLLPGYAPPTSSPPQDFVVYNVNVNSVSNNGQCCLWTVPAGITYAVFEMWSGGGSGGGGCCCMQGGGAGSGGYAVKGCNVVAGEQIRICAAGSGCCVSSSSGFDGYCSFVCSTGGGLNGTWESKVCGGLAPSITPRCNYFQGCYGCCSSCFCCGGRSLNADFTVGGTQGSAAPNQFCFGHGWQQTSDAPMMGGMRHGPGGCAGCGGETMFGNFPGGGGFSAQIHSGVCCCGGPGAGGAVYVVFY